MNSRTPSHYRVSITDMFDHCSNFRVGSTILYDVYQRALKIDSSKQASNQHYSSQPTQNAPLTQSVMYKPLLI
ncbi:hypothetical protein C9I86_12925 [Photobacterium sp. NCIMB 13483]|uniref:hypothetical protein n=1 Tax=Photobacterium sp. NCIMB 13483 TaxID=2022103 RepID=UPI000D15F0A1|nr:hypothetical protein C9I86_12925 [Photobacterium sp. NCIMB 13483]